MLAFEPFGGSMDEWGQILATFPDHEIFQAPAWLAFIAETQKATPVIAVLKEGSQPVGYFAGLTVRRFGAKILGSPFPGWTTSHMGMRLREGISRREATRALVEYAFDDLNCVHLELVDPRFAAQDVAGLGFEIQMTKSWMIDLSAPEEELFAKAKSSCRRSIRKAKRMGVAIEQAQDEFFADDYYAQLRDVFAKQGLVPTYDKARVQALIRHLLPTGLLLLVRARDSKGECIATGIFPAMNGLVDYWGVASWRPHQILRPNEAIMWYAMCYWKGRGMKLLDAGGAGYLQKYGGHHVGVLRLAKSRFPLLWNARGVAKRVFAIRQRIVGKLRGAS
jgi:hypothetical protein